ncbi:MAG: hypothetical protein ACO1OB_13775 [Archangium sp.]
MGFVDLQCGARVVRVDNSICEMASERVFWREFQTTGAPTLTVRRHSHLEGTPISAPLGDCVFRRDDDAHLDVQVEDGMFRGELVLRLAWYLCATGQGAVLIHASAVKSEHSALVACGKSGDGKSTLSRLSVEAGLTLLTDEVVMLFPDGTVSGTPFRSDFDHAGTPGLTRAKYFVALHKAQLEEFKALSALDAVQLAMSQCFDVAEVALPRVEVRRRLLAFLSNVEPRTFSFRKDVEAGRFVKRSLASSP